MHYKMYLFLIIIFSFFSLALKADTICTKVIGSDSCVDSYLLSKKLPSIPDSKLQKEMAYFFKTFSSKTEEELINSARKIDYNYQKRLNKIFKDSKSSMFFSRLDTDTPTKNKRNKKLKENVFNNPKEKTKRRRIDRNTIVLKKSNPKMNLIDEKQIKYNFAPDILISHKSLFKSITRTYIKFYPVLYP